MKIFSSCDGPLVMNVTFKELSLVIGFFFLTHSLACLFLGAFALRKETGRSRCVTLCGHFQTCSLLSRSETESPGTLTSNGSILHPSDDR